METYPKRSNHDGSLKLPYTGKNSLSGEWSIKHGYYFEDEQLPDIDKIWEIKEIADDYGDDDSALPKELVKQSILITQPGFRKINAMEMDLETAYKYVSRWMPDPDSQRIFDFITQNGSAKIPVMNALHDITEIYDRHVNLHEKLLVSSDKFKKIDEKFETVRSTAYWMVLYLMANQPSVRKFGRVG